jgi:hypothetical protein
MALPYRFYLLAYNFNGASDPSDIATLTPCDVPSSWSKPTKVSTTTSSISISWNEPGSNGGCAITSYAVYMDDGYGGLFIEVNSALDPLVRDLPSLGALTITTFPNALMQGFIFRIKVRVFNAAGYVDSSILGVVLASLPLQPPSPTKTTSKTTTSKITIDISNFPTASNGGSSILSYNIQMDDGYGGDYVSMVGYTSPYLLTTYTATGLTKSLSYIFRYRAKNIHGWGPFSNDFYATAA